MLIHTPKPVSAEQSVDASASVINAQRKIYIAGRQRMLIQLMANSACYARLEIRTDYHNGQLGVAHWLFSRTLDDLRLGNQLRLMTAESDPAILAGIDRVAGLQINRNKWLR